MILYSPLFLLGMSAAMYNIHAMNIPSWMCDKAMREASRKPAKSKKQGHRLMTLLSSPAGSQPLTPS